jgi:D-amino-acid dehydrogenase
VSAILRSDETLVIGAGAVGLSTAYWLALAGVSVRVLDRGGVGEGASLANGGWVNRSDAVPLPAPGAARFVLSKIGRADSPIYVRPRANLDQAVWLLRFLSHCRRAPYERGAAALTLLARPAADLYQELERSGADFHFEQSGHLHVFADPRRMKSTLRAASLLRELGYDARHEVLSAAEVRDLEPVLTDRVGGGVLFPNEGHVRPAEFTRALAARLEALGVPIETGVEVQALEARSGGATGCVTADGYRSAANVVLAAGVGSRVLAESVEEKLPVIAGKGYSFALGLPKPIRRTLLLGESKVGLTPLGSRTRMLGTMEFSDQRPVLRRRRIDAMLNAAREYLHGVPADLTGDEVDDGWVGLRPMTVDGLPIIDRCRSHDDVFVATGHGMLGMMLGPATGKALAEFVQTGQRPGVLEPFRVDRFKARAPASRGHARLLRHAETA